MSFPRKKQKFVSTDRDVTSKSAWYHPEQHYETFSVAIGSCEFTLHSPKLSENQFVEVMSALSIKEPHVTLLRDFGLFELSWYANFPTLLLKTSISW